MFGVFKVPKAFQAAEFTSLRELLNARKEQSLDNQSQAALNFPGGNKNGLDVNGIDFAAFQLSLNDGNSYHLAWLLALQDKRTIKPGEDYFSQQVTLQQKNQAILLHDSINNNISQWQFNDPKTGAGFKILEVPPFEFITVNKKQAYSGSARFLITH
ncbi:hypothetical protein [Acetonema longum]|uniref:Uncharacterized protein n=1 Tax=Acetonema longum DSM 6540 TaxID=1009370 RepID=F7NDX2_9FIRM|nr:hypothetical protein [Acetonema longum]EGO65787.1 hypothetical protein ALO_01150 [Acetonema longum DSM 6540]